MRKSDNAPIFSVQRLLISSMSADHELEVSLTPLIAANNSHCRLTGPPQCLAGYIYIVSGLYAQF